MKLLKHLRLLGMVFVNAARDVVSHLDRRASPRR